MDTYRGSHEDPLSLHRYTYCMNNPIRYYDPSGHSWKSFWNGVKNDETTETDNSNAKNVGEGGKGSVGQKYSGTRNAEIDFVNGKGKSTLFKHAGKHGYGSSTI